MNYITKERLKNLFRLVLEANMKGKKIAFNFYPDVQYVEIRTKYPNVWGWYYEGDLSKIEDYEKMLKVLFDIMEV